MASLAREEKIDLGAVIQRGFSVIGRNAPAYLVIAFLLTGVPTFITQYGSFAAIEGASGSAVALTAVMGFISLFTGFLLQATVVRSAILDLSGRPADVTGSLMAALGLLLPMIGLAIVSFVAIGLASMLLIVPGIMLYVAWIVATPVLVEERPGVFASLNRSLELTRGSRWGIFGLLLLFAIAWIIVAGVLSIFAPENGYENPLLSGAVQALISTLMGLVGAAMLASLYVELRTVKEGATTDSLAAIFA
jgi:hypothetical protein